MYGRAKGKRESKRKNSEQTNTLRYNPDRLVKKKRKEEHLEKII